MFENFSGVSILASFPSIISKILSFVSVITAKTGVLILIPLYLLAFYLNCSKKQAFRNLSMVCISAGFAYAWHLQSMLPQDFVRDPRVLPIGLLAIIISSTFMLLGEKQLTRNAGLLCAMFSVNCLYTQMPLEKTESKNMDYQIKKGQVKKDRLFFYQHPGNSTLRIDVYKDAVALHYNALLIGQKPKYFKRRFFPRQGLLFQWLVDGKVIDFDNVVRTSKGLRCEYNGAKLYINLIQDRQDKFRTSAKFRLEDPEEGRKHEVRAWGEVVGNMSILEKSAAKPVKMNPNQEYNKPDWCYIASEGALMFLSGFEKVQAIGQTGMFWGYQTYCATQALGTAKVQELSIRMAPMLVSELGRSSTLSRQQVVLETDEADSDPEELLLEDRQELIFRHYWYYFWIFVLMEKITEFCNSALPVILLLALVFYFFGVVCFYIILGILRLFARVMLHFQVKISYPDDYKYGLWIVIRIGIITFLPQGILTNSGIFYQRPLLWIEDGFRLADDNVFASIAFMSSRFIAMMSRCALLLFGNADLGMRVITVALIFLSVGSLYLTFMLSRPKIRHLIGFYEWLFIIFWNMLLCAILYSSLATTLDLPQLTMRHFAFLEYMPIYCCATLCAYIMVLGQRNDSRDLTQMILNLVLPILLFLLSNVGAVIFVRFSKIATPVSTFFFLIISMLETPKALLKDGGLLRALREAFGYKRRPRLT